MSITKKVIYPPSSILDLSSINRDFEFIILWMLKNNEQCEWSHFLVDPVNISAATLSKYMNILLEKKFVEKVKKGVYKLTSEGEIRFIELQSKQKLDTELSYPPVLISKRRNYDHTILWMVYNNSICKWSDFTEPPLSINQSSLSKAINKLLDLEYIERTENREYIITSNGESEYLRILKEYDLDRQSILDQESKRIEVITEKTNQFFESYKIENNDLKYRYLTMALKLDYTKFEELSDEEDFDKILFFLSLNHPNEYPKYISPEKFATDYDIDSITLKFFLKKIVDEKDIYPIKFFKLETDDDKVFYFQENGRFERILRAIVEDYITQFSYLNTFNQKASNGGEILTIKNVIRQIIDDLTLNVFNKKLRGTLEKFLPSYINYLAYKIETKKTLINQSEKLESFTYRSFFSEYQPFVRYDDTSSEGDIITYYYLDTGIFEALDPYFLNKVDFLNTDEFKQEFISTQNLDLFEKVIDILYRDKITKVEGFYLENTRKFTDFEDFLISDLISTVSLNYQKSIDYSSKMISYAPNSYIGYLLQSLTYFEMSEFEKAMEVIEEGIINSDHLFLKIQKIQILLKLQKYSEIKMLIDNLISMNSENPILLGLKSISYCKNCEKPEGVNPIDIIDNAIQLNPNDKRLLILKAIILCFERKYKQAKSFIKRELGINIFSKNARIDTSALFILIFSYLARGKIEKALSIAKELEIQYPDHKISLLAKALIQGYNLIYNFSEEERNKEQFLSLIDKLISLESIKFRESRIIQMKALVLHSLKENNNAIEEMDKAMELDRYNYELASMKIYFFSELEDKDTALMFVDDYIARYPNREIDLLLFKSFLYYYIGR
ncbi:MAG: hypothetical protein ACFE9R_07640, partial [Candidatus Hermodarchaeota archaeon]